MDWIEYIFSPFTSQKKYGPTMDSNQVEGKVMHSYQASDGNAAHIAVQPPSGSVADSHILHSEETKESQSVLKVIETPLPLTLSSQLPIVHSNEPSKLFALIIGIDKYSSLPRLSGSVNDAKAVEEFLKLDMNVPSDRIHHLHDHEATRDRIMNAFRQLSEEVKIEMDDPILIYYAGHGTQLPPPDNWEAGGPGRKIQGICSYDYSKGVVHAIPDRSIGALLNLISEKKGNNITVIFDCCYSSSGTRVGVLSTDIRGVVLDDELPLDLDRPGFSAPLDRGSRTTTRFGVRGLGSHVLVAACKETEEAREDGQRGRFTAALLDLLKQEGRMKTLTYSDIVKHIKPIQNQNPQVEGMHRDRIIFNAKAARHCPFYSVRFNSGERNFILHAGSAHGVSIGSKFTIYEDQDLFLKSSPWGVLVVSRVMSLISVLIRSEETSGIDLVKPGIAVLYVGGADQALSLMACYDPSQLPATFHEAIQLRREEGIISLDDENATLEMRLENGHLVFDILEPTIKASGLDRVYYSAKPTDTAGDVARILSAGCSFFWHLMRQHDHCITDTLEVEFLELEVSKYDPIGYPIASPIGENLLWDGAIDLYVDGTPKPYGIKLTNNSDWDLFPAAFYFDHSDWSIHEYYHPGTGGQFETEAPLRKKGGSLTIGYGCGGRNPISFRLNRENQDFDVGHLKIVFTTRSTDLRHIAQPSPFTARRAVFEFQLFLDTWVSLQYPIIQRRA